MADKDHNAGTEKEPSWLSKCLLYMTQKPSMVFLQKMEQKGAPIEQSIDTTSNDSTSTVTSQPINQSQTTSPIKEKPRFGNLSDFFSSF